MIHRFIRGLVEDHRRYHPPTQVIGPRDDAPDYLTRWCALPKNPLFNIYIHKFGDDDEDRALHDHPWPSLSYLLDGTMDEVMDGRVMRREQGDWVYRSPWHRHRLKLVSHTATTLFIVGPRVRQWGFWCPKGFVYWKSFVDPNDPGKVGAGCGEFK